MNSQDDFDPADLCRQMADRIERIDRADFGGFILVVPPPSEDGEINPIEVLLVDPNQDLANFWSTAKSKTAIAADEFVARQSMPQMGSYR